MLLTLAKVLSKLLKTLVAFLDYRICKLSEKQTLDLSKTEKAAQLAIEGINTAKIVKVNKCAEALVKLETQRSELKALA